MARASDGILGNFTGKLGKVSARIVDGDTIYSLRPAHYKISSEPKLVETRQKFAVTIAFASKVAALQTLNDIWKLNKEPKLSAFNVITRHNFNLSSALSPTLNNIITPNGFETPVTTAAIASGKLTGALAALNTLLTIPSNAVNLSINAVISLSDPKSSRDPFFKVIPVSKEEVNFVFNKTYNFQIDFSIDNAAAVAAYNQKFIYLAIAMKSANDQILKYSKSYALISN
jgi:hypothetical protein